jgi:hypothetical protein
MHTQHTRTHTGRTTKLADEVDHCNDTILRISTVLHAGPRAAGISRFWAVYFGTDAVYGHVVNVMYAS